MSQPHEFYWHVGADPELQETMPEHWVDYLKCTLNNLPFDRFVDTVIAPNQVMHEQSAWQPPEERVLTPYGDICLQRAKDLIDTNKQLYVYWSGGIDSTTVITSLIQAGVPKDQLTVVLNDSSKKEHYAFFKRFIEKDYAKLRTRGAAQLLKSDPEGIVVTGELNDQLFGADVMHAVYLRLGFDFLMQKPHRQLYGLAMSVAHEMPMKSAMLVYDAICESAAAVKRPLPTLFDVFWFANFCFKWQNVCFRMFAYDAFERSSKLERDDFDRVRHFFGTKEFQDWSWSGHEKKHDGTWRSYKITAKRFIYRFDGDEDFLNNGVKLVSLRPSETTFGMLTTDYQFIEKERPDIQ